MDTKATEDQPFEALEQESATKDFWCEPVYLAQKIAKEDFTPIDVKDDGCGSTCASCGSTCAGCGSTCAGCGSTCASCGSTCAG